MRSRKVGKLGKARTKRKQETKGEKQARKGGGKDKVKMIRPRWRIATTRSPKEENKKSKQLRTQVMNGKTS